LARKTRALGFETLYCANGDDKGLMRVAKSEGRIILTADKTLFGRASSGKVKVLLVSGRTDSRRLASILVAAKSSDISLIRGGPLCSLCGGGLVKMKRAEVAGRVPHLVESRHRLFLMCKACGKYYWKGSHWKKLRWLERILAEVPVATVS